MEKTLDRTKSRCREAPTVFPWRRGVALNEWVLPKFKKDDYTGDASGRKN